MVSVYNKFLEDLCEKLEARTVQTLPKDWRKNLTCPNCGADANRQKCMFDLGGDCPRHNPENYDPSPYIDIPDELCVTAAAELRKIINNSLSIKRSKGSNIREVKLTASKRFESENKEMPSKDGKNDFSRNRH